MYYNKLFEVSTAMPTHLLFRYCRAPLLTVINLRKNITGPPYNSVEEHILSRNFEWALCITAILGFSLTINYSLHVAVDIGSRYNLLNKDGLILKAFTTTSNVRGTARTKRAATRKVNVMLTNARSMHGSASPTAKESSSTSPLVSSMQKSLSDEVFQNFTLRGESFEPCGSIFWVIEKLRTGQLFHTEGIWLPARLLIFQFGQIVIAVLILFLLFVAVDRAAERADKARKSLDEDLPDWIVAFVPTGSQVQTALFPAACISVVVAFLLTIIYIPR